MTVSNVIDDKTDNFISVTLCNLHDYSSNSPREHVDCYDGEHVPKDCRNKKRMAKAMGQDCPGGGKRSTTSPAIEEPADVQSADGKWKESFGPSN